MQILMVEDHPIFRVGACQLIAQNLPQAQVREVTSLADAMLAVHQQNWDVIITDLNLPDSHGIEVVPQLVRNAPKTPLLVLSFNEESAYAQRALELGAMGYIAKDSAAEHLITAIRQVVAGGRYISPALANQLVSIVLGGNHAILHHQLSAQEYRVMLQLAAGARVVDIASGMNLSAKTISTYRSRIFEKLNVLSNLELSRYCKKHDLIEKV